MIRANFIMAMTIWGMFRLSTAYWGIELRYLLTKVKLQGMEDRFRIWSNIMAAIVTVNVLYPLCLIAGISTEPSLCCTLYRLSLQMLSL